jgi:hypothetical protein
MVVVVVFAASLVGTSEMMVVGFCRKFAWNLNMSTASYQRIQ